METLNSIKYYIIGSVALLVLGFGIGKATTKPQIITETKIETVIKEVEVKKDNIVTTEHQVIKPDGTKVIDTSTIDKTVDSTNTDTSTISDVTTKTGAIPPKWHVGLSANRSNPLLPETYYSFNVEKRLLGPFFIGFSASTHKEAGFMLGFEF